MIGFTKTSQSQPRKLDRSVAFQVLDYMDKGVALLDTPRSQGINLVGPRLGSCWRYRIGDLRVICDIQDNVLTVLVVEIGRRREIYR